MNNIKIIRKGTNIKIVIKNLTDKSPKAKVTHVTPEPKKANEKNKNVSIVDEIRDDTKGGINHILFFNLSKIFISSS